MSADAVFGLIAAAGLILVAVAIVPRLTRTGNRGVAAIAALPLLAAAVLVAYVFGEDSYRGNGISRWEAYRSPGGSLGALFVLSVGVMIVLAALLAYAGLRGRNGLLRATAFAAAMAAFFLLTPTIVGFTSN